MTGPGPGRVKTPFVFLVAGEPSGDRLGARLMAALKRETGGRIRFAGVGGPEMAAEGLHSLIPIADLAVMGLVEVLPHIPRILRDIRTVVAQVRSLCPDIVVTIDSPGFTLEISQRLAGRGIPLVHYVAPSVWAWKPGRARRMARYLDHLLALLPFEPPYFERHGLATTFVGHPAIEKAAAEDAEAFRRRLGIAPGAPLICVLPGSRRGEVRRLGPVFGAALNELHGRFPTLCAVVPTVSTVADTVERMARDWPVPASVLPRVEDKTAAFAAADVALAASGTVAVELAVAGLPAVIAYRLTPLSAFLTRRLVKLRHVSLPNILLGREVQPEYLQERCTAGNLAAAIQRLLTNPAARAARIEGARAAVALLDPGEAAPSTYAARRVLGLIERARLPGNEIQNPKEDP